MVDVARALMGLGAAFKNEVPQFQQRMQQEDLYNMKMAEMDMARQDALAKREEERKKTLFQDVATARQLFDQGDFSSISDIARDRLDILSPMGVNTRDSQRLLQLADAAQSGDPQAIRGLKNQLDTIYSVGSLYNLNGGGDAPASFRGLQLQARAAGLQEGTPEYQEFMRYGGASGDLGAAKTTTYKNGTVVKITRLGAPEVYGPDGQLVTDETQKREVLDAAIKEGIAYEGDVATARARGTAEEGAAQEVLETGIRQARNIGRLKDALRILDRVETGGLAAIGLKTKRALGLTDADEAMLAYTLRMNVLKQLKPTFGAAFTAREGELLASIEANEDQSTAANRALLEDMIRQMELDIDRAKLYAPDLGTGGQRALRTMQGFMNQNFYTGDDGQGQGADPAAGQGVGSPEPVGGTTFVYDPVTKKLVPQGQ